MLTFANDWGSLLFDVTAKSVLLMMAAWLGLRLLRIQNVNAQHRVWTLVMVGMLALPLLIPVTPRIEIPHWMAFSPVPVPPVLVDHSNQNTLPGPGATRISTSPSNGEPSDATPFNDLLQDNERVAANAFEPSNFNGADSQSIPAANATSSTAEEAHRAESKSSPEHAATGLAGRPGLLPILVSIHTLVGLTFLLRIGIGLIATRRITRQAEKIDTVELLTNSRVSLLQSESTSVPVTIGYFRPKVLLPKEWHTWSAEKLRSVLAHEMAHVRRADWLVTLLSELNRAFHWFNPVSWSLRRKLAELAEHNCDDAVIASEGNRAEYATYLLEVATSLSQAGSRYRPPLQSVAMARKPAVETRIDAILDDSRPLARRLGWIGAFALMTIMVPAILLAAGLSPEQQADETSVPTEEKQAKDPVEDDNADNPSATQEKPFIYSGQVVTPDGKPAAGVNVRLVYWFWDQTQKIREKPDAVTDSEGRFHIKMMKDDFYQTADSVPPWTWASLAFTKKGLGMAIAPSVAFEKSGQAVKHLKQEPRFTEQRLRDLLSKNQGPITLKQDRLPITGRVVNTEGQPVANVKVSVVSTATGEDNSLDAWLEAAQQEHANFHQVRNEVPKHLYGPIVKRLITPVLTDEKGEFTLTGIGEEQLVEISFEAPGIVSTGAFGRTVKGEKVEFDGGPFERQVVMGTHIVHVTSQSKPIVGTVTDKSGNPIPGVQVSCQESYVTMAANQQEKVGSKFARAVTNKQGRYRLEGLPNSKHNNLHFVAAAKAGFLSRFVRADNRGNDSQPVTVDTELSKGVLLEGRVTDRETGAGVSGHVKYLKTAAKPKSGLVLRENNEATVETVRSNSEGHFQIVVPSGKGYLAFRAFNDAYEKKFHRPKNAVEMANRFALSMFPARRMPEYHALHEFASETASQDSIEMHVVRGRIIHGTVVDTSGKVVDGQYAGRTEHYFWQPLQDGKFEVADYDEEFPRRLTFINADKTMAGTLVLKDKVENTHKVQLQPAAAVKGRIVNSDGEPLPGVRLMSGHALIMPNPSGTPAGSQVPQAPLPPHPNRRELTTDDEGRFEIKGLVPNVAYSMHGYEAVEFVGPETLQGSVMKGLKIEAGKTHDLGDVVFAKPDLEKLRREAEAAKRANKQRNANSAEIKKATVEPPALEPAPANKEKADKPLAESKPQTVTIRGQVVDPAGKPKNNVDLYWPTLTKVRSLNPGDVAMKKVATTDEKGLFVANDLVFAAQAMDLPIIAVAKGYGMTWQDITKRQGQNVSLQLAEEQVIKGQVLNTEGAPVAGTNIGIRSLFADSRGTIKPFLTAWKSEWQSAAMKIDRRLFIGMHLMAKITSAAKTDQQGRFELRGIGKQQAAWLNIASNQHASAAAIVITNSDFQPDDYRQAHRNSPFVMGSRAAPKLFGPDLKIIVEAGKTIQGTVSDMETKKPLAGVSIYVSTGYDQASTAISDAKGKYTLTGIRAKVDSELLVGLRKPGTRYLARTIAIKPDSGLAPTQLDVDLAKGVTLKGRVTEAETGAPLRAGGVRVVPLPENNWQDKPGYDGYKRSRLMESVMPDGSFEFTVIPGPLVLLVQAGGDPDIVINGRPIRPYRRGEFSEEDRKRVKIHEPGRSFYTSSNGLDFFESGMKVIDVPEDATEHQVEVKVNRGLEVGIKIVDNQGKPVEGTMVCGMTESWPITFPAKKSTCRIYGLDPEKPRRVLLYHPERQLAGSIKLRGDEKEMPVVKLSPAIKLAGQAVNEDGDPLANAAIGFQWFDRNAREFQRQLNMSQSAITTDDEGRFSVAGIMPGSFRLTFKQGKQRYRSDKWDEAETAQTALKKAAIIVQPQ